MLGRKHRDHFLCLYKVANADSSHWAEHVGAGSWQREGSQTLSDRVRADHNVEDYLKA